MTSKKEQKYPQLQSIRLGPEYAWISRALQKMSARADMPVGALIRELLVEVLGRDGNQSLDVQMARHQGTVATLPPTRLLAGYEHLPTAIEATRKQASGRLGYDVEGADVLRWALWNGLVMRGVKAPSKPKDIYAEILRRPGVPAPVLAAEFGMTQRAVRTAWERLGVQGEPSKPLTAKQLRVALRKDLTQTAAAKLLGVSQKTVSLYRKKAAAKRRKSTPPKKS